MNPLAVLGLVLSGLPVLWASGMGDVCAIDLKYKVITQNWANAVYAVYGLAQQHKTDPHAGVYLKAIIALADHIDFNVYANTNPSNHSVALQTVCLSVQGAYAAAFAKAGFDPNHIFHSPGTIGGEDAFHSALINYGLVSTNVFQAYKDSRSVRNPTKYQSIIVGFQTNDLEQDEAVENHNGAACVKFGALTSHFGARALQSPTDTATDCGTPFL
ncbi:hypothetical protein BV898_07175 [Hypsibius exemplaris]|uniref:Uncharacterized protein n=1 Tax=Hypsibius exemplaris TaxID=2072580 RepID=A0A1W0WU56_HYPEX|nr:hypothetical protein BV898_07175 [Hypsibius exemplaris]